MPIQFYQYFGCTNLWLLYLSEWLRPIRSASFLLHREGSWPGTYIKRKRKLIFIIGFCICRKNFMRLFISATSGCTLPSWCCLFNRWLCEERYCLSVMVLSQGGREGRIATFFFHFFNFVGKKKCNNFLAYIFLFL